VCYLLKAIIIIIISNIITTQCGITMLPLIKYVAAGCMTIVTAALLLKEEKEMSV
jgi:hypothetical protein